ncbi:MAG: hypothetical protein FWF92_04715 [Oscillospiraceae bacterium]|nr:hypothetical protein [Oscillospiraceae bacterium]
MKTQNKHVKIDLCGDWEFSFVDYKNDKNHKAINELKNAGLKSYHCKVPGNFELDLYKNKLCGEPFYGMNPVKIREMTENCGVYYYRKFDLPEIKTENANPVLIFEGLDCFADVYINGYCAIISSNMLIEHKFYIPNNTEYNLLKEKDNEILVYIKPAIEMAKYYEYPPSVAAMGANTESLYVRKAPHMYGWDIMPRFLSSGIWRPVYIEYLPEERIDEIFLNTSSVNSNNAEIIFNCNLKLNNNKTDKYTVGLKMTCGDSIVDLDYDIYFQNIKKRFNINNPKLWFSKGSGEQNLYETEIYLKKNGVIIDEYKLKYGVRTVKLNRTSTTDQFGSGAFEFIINNIKIFMKGSNWVPADAFHSRDRERIPAILEMAEDLNCNMLRCWGGNVYEDDLFYEICDEKGFLIWQDFAFACAVYPQDNAFCQVVREEAITVIKRLRNHACVALWSGDNECDEAYLWNNLGDPNKNKLTREILPEAVKTYDGSRPYIASSPYFDENVIKTGTEYASEKHLWGPRDYYKSLFYINSICHFVSEIGYHGCPSVKSIKKFISPENLWTGADKIAKDEQWLLHSTSPVPELHLYDYRIQLMLNQIAEVFDKSPENLKDFVLASQIVQAEAKKFFIELFRGNKWRRSGILWWNLMDGWPQFSDAIVDYYFDKKLAYYFIKNSQEQLTVILREPDNWKQEIVIVNDYLSPQSVNFKIIDIDTSEILKSGNIIVSENSNIIAGNIPFVHGQKRFLVIEWHIENNNINGKNHYLSGHPPFSHEQYIKWLDKSGMFDEWLDKTQDW